MPNRKGENYSYSTHKRVDVIRHRLWCGECMVYDEDGKFVPQEMFVTQSFTLASIPPITTHMLECKAGHQVESNISYPYVTYQEI